MAPAEAPTISEEQRQAKCVQIVPSRHNLVLKDCRKEGLVQAGLHWERNQADRRHPWYPMPSGLPLTMPSAGEPEVAAFGSLVGRESPLACISGIEPCPSPAPDGGALGTCSDHPAFQGWALSCSPDLHSMAFVHQCLLQSGASLFCPNCSPGQRGPFLSRCKSPLEAPPYLSPVREH